MRKTQQTRTDLSGSKTPVSNDYCWRQLVRVFTVFTLIVVSAPVQSSEYSLHLQREIKSAQSDAAALIKQWHLSLLIYSAEI